MAYVGLHNHDERSNFRGRDALIKTEKDKLKQVEGE